MWKYFQILPDNKPILMSLKISRQKYILLNQFLLDTILAENFSVQKLSLKAKSPA